MNSRADAEANFAEHLKDINLPGARLGYLLAAILVPCATVLDWVGVPDKAWEFLGIRLVAGLLALCGWAFTFSPAARRSTVLLGAGPPLLSAATIEVLVLKLEGPTSPYYAGLNLCILAVAVLYTWRWVNSIAVCIAIIMLWLVPAIPVAIADPHTIRPLFNNFVFLLLTSVIVVSSSVIRYGAAAREFFVRSELAATSTELAGTLERLQELDRLKNEFFANVSHELKTPLTLILSPVEDLLGRELHADIRNSLSMVRRNAQRLLRMIDDLLDLARLDTGGLRLRVAEVDLKELAERVVEAAAPAAANGGISLTFEADNSNPDVYGDPHRLEIIITNLVGNALKFTPSGGSVCVTFESTASSVSVSVADTGPGISEADQERIFDRFYQVEGSERRKQGGAGIGLALARKLADLHGGSLGVWSKLAEGSVFELKLQTGRRHFDKEVVERRRVRLDEHPGRRAEDRSLSEPVESPKPIVLVPDQETIRLDRGRRARVLVAEDETDLRDFIVSILDSEFDVIAVADGAEALRQVRKERPDLVLTDVMMPGTSGIDLCRAIKGEPTLKATPVILLTARAGADSTLEGYSAGADDFVTKPFHPRVLTARIKAQLKLRSMGLQLADQARLATAGTLAAGIAHEVKNPLNAVLNAARVLSRSEPGPELQRKLLAVAHDGAQRIADIISTLEEHVRPADGLGASACDVNQGLESALRLLEHKLGSITVSYTRNTSRPVLAKARELNQVFLNLLDNAARAAPSGIWIQTSDLAGDVLISVGDDGGGVPAEAVDMIFEPFFTTRDVGQGTGLGLYLCRRIVNEYGGSIRYHARPSGGATFVIQMPALTDSG